MTLLLVGVAQTPTADAQSGRIALAYYFGWFSMDSWNDGRLIDRPAQPYHSWQTETIARHITQAQSAGFDGFVMSWLGPQDGGTYGVFEVLLDQAAQRGFYASASVDMALGAYLTTQQQVTDAIGDLNTKVWHGGYLKYGGKPVIYFYNQGRFSIAQWQQIRNTVDPNRDTIWVAEGLDTSYISSGAFDGLYLFNVAWSSNASATAIQWRSATYGAGGTYFSATAMPGWDESRIEGRTNPTDPQSRDGGDFLAQSWDGAVSSGADVIMVVSWNEYFENSHIEPSQLHGTTAIDVLRPRIAAWKGVAPPAPITVEVAPVQEQPAQEAAPAEPAAPPPPQQPNITTADSPTGAVYITGPVTNMRDAPSENGGIITSIPAGTRLAVLGKNDTSQWIQVDYTGTVGWVAGWLATYEGDMNAVPFVTP